MGQSFQISENIAPLTRVSNTTITMASSYLGKPTKITVGAQQYRAQSTITLNTTTTGINGLDAGILVLNTLYYVYAVQSFGVLGLVASTAAPTTGPTGFLAWKEIGRFRTFLGNASISTVVNRLIGNDRSIRNIISKWESFAAVTAGALTLTTLTGSRVSDGQTLKMRVQFDATGASVGVVSLAIPDSLSIDNSAIVSTLANQNSLGHGTIFQSSNGKRDVIPVYQDSTSVKFIYENDTAALVVLTPSSPFVWANGDRTVVYVEVPIAEWIGLLDN